CGAWDNGLSGHWMF
nr:immunoglobulin light chain junction region [Macaca mulatta]